MDFAAIGSFRPTAIYTKVRYLTFARPRNKQRVTIVQAVVHRFKTRLSEPTTALVGKDTASEGCSREAKYRTHMPIWCQVCNHPGVERASVRIEFVHDMYTSESCSEGISIAACGGDFGRRVSSPYLLLNANCFHYFCGPLRDFGSIRGDVRTTLVDFAFWLRLRGLFLIPCSPWL